MNNRLVREVLKRKYGGGGRTVSSLAIAETLIQSLNLKDYCREGDYRQGEKIDEEFPPFQVVLARLVESRYAEHAGLQPLIGSKEYLNRIAERIVNLKFSDELDNPGKNVATFPRSNAAGEAYEAEMERRQMDEIKPLLVKIMKGTDDLLNDRMPPHKKNTVKKS